MLANFGFEFLKHSLIIIDTVFLLVGQFLFSRVLQFEILIVDLFDILK